MNDLADIALPSSTSNPDVDALIYAERIDMLYRQLPTSVGGNMVGAVVLVGSLSADQPRSSLIVWFLSVALLQGWRLWLHYRNEKTGMVRENPRRAALIWAGGAAVSGALWGATALVFYASGHVMYQAILTILVFGLTASAVPLIGSHMPSFYAFVLPALLPFIARNAYENDTPHFIVSFILLAVGLGLLSFVRNYNSMLTESLRNRFEKQRLADQLAAQNVDLENAKVVAEQANRSKTQFFAAASHDLRQPLHALGLFASALTEKVRDPQVGPLVSSISTSVQALEALFNELLDISKLDSGIIKPNISQFALDAIFDRLRAEFEAEAADKGLKLTIHSDHHVVASDPVLLERIVRNLVSNAIRYTSEGRIDVTASESGNTLCIEVRDTGMGIRAEDQQRIFEEFLQLGNPGRTSKKGLGLGLSIVERLCTLLGYTMRLKSEFGEGTVFSFDVPLGDRALGSADKMPAAVLARTNLQGKLIAVIDDEGAIVDGMRVLLEQWGAKVLTSHTGDDIVAAVHAEGAMPDLLIVDYRLGINETGIEIAQRIREELDPEIPGILVTGSITPDLAELARTANLDFMLKPVNAAQLRERIGTALKLELASETAH